MPDPRALEGPPSEARADRAGVGAAGGPVRKPDAFSRSGRERPSALWGTFPLTELVIVVAVAIMVLGFARGRDDGAIAIGAGLALCVLAVAELTAREHFAGFRAHTLLLAFLPTAVVQGALYLLVGRSWTGPVALAGDTVVFFALAGALRRAFRGANDRRGRRLT